MGSINLTYSEFKSVVISKQLWWQCVAETSKYTIWANDSFDKFETQIFREDPHIINFDWEAEQLNLADFEANYYESCNRPNTISPTAAQSQFYGRTIELAQGVTFGYCEWGFEDDAYVTKVLPCPIDAQKGDYVEFEVWALPGVLDEEAVKVDQYAYTIPLRGSTPLPWIYGSGGGLIPAYCTVRCYYHRTDASVLRDFNVIAEFQM